MRSWFPVLEEDVCTKEVINHMKSSIVPKTEAPSYSTKFSWLCKCLLQNHLKRLLLEQWRTSWWHTNSLEAFWHSKPHHLQFSRLSRYLCTYFPLAWILLFYLLLIIRSIPAERDLTAQILKGLTIAANFCFSNGSLSFHSLTILNGWKGGQIFVNQ